MNSFLEKLIVNYIFLGILVTPIFLDKANPKRTEIGLNYKVSSIWPEDSQEAGLFHRKVIKYY